MTELEALRRVAEAARVLATRNLGRAVLGWQELDAALDALSALPPATEPEPVGEVVEVVVNVRLSNDRSVYIASGMGALNGDWVESRMGGTIATIRARVPLPRVPEVVGEVG